MIWLTWRQLRTQVAVVFGAIAVLLALLAATGPHLVRQYHADGSRFLSDISSTDSRLYVVGVLAVLAVPAIIGLFWGAPLVTRELEAGTHRLAWTQTTRTRWLAAKLGVTGLAAIAAAGLLSLAVTWWAEPVDAAIAGVRGLPSPGLLVFTRLSREIFDSRGIAPLGYAAFAFVLGVTIGVITRRTLPAMAIFLVFFAVTQIGVSLWVRPSHVAPDHLTTPIPAANMLSLNVDNSLTVVVDEPGAWITSEQTVNAAGHPAHAPSSITNCLMGAGGPGRGMQACLARLTREGDRQQVSYEPAGRFWALQWDETVIYLILALLLAGLCTWWIRHRLS
jgi:hypothetical protein